jgi:hypothetical protein
LIALLPLFALLHECIARVLRFLHTHRCPIMQLNIACTHAEALFIPYILERPPIAPFLPLAFLGAECGVLGMASVIEAG